MRGRILQTNNLYPYKRDLYYTLNSIILKQDNKLVFVKGLRHIGKTVLLRQLAASHLDKCLYFDGQEFTGSLFDEISKAYAHGIRLFFIDEISKFDNEFDTVDSLKTFCYKATFIVTGSSMMGIEKMINRIGRGVSYLLTPISYKEYLNINNLSSSKELLSEFLKSRLNGSFIDEIERTLTDTVESNYRHAREPLTHFTQGSIKRALELIILRIINFDSQKCLYFRGVEEYFELTDEDYDIFKARYKELYSEFESPLNSDKLKSLFNFLFQSGLIGFTQSYEEFFSPSQGLYYTTNLQFVYYMITYLGSKLGKSVNLNNVYSYIRGDLFELQMYNELEGYLTFGTYGRYRDSDAREVDFFCKTDRVIGLEFKNTKNNKVNTKASKNYIALIEKKIFDCIYIIGVDLDEIKDWGNGIVEYPADRFLANKNQILNLTHKDDTLTLSDAFGSFPTWKTIN